MKYITLSFLMCFGIAQAASAEQYECNLSDDTRYHLIAPKILIDVAADGSGSTVVDGILAHFDQAPATATRVVKKRNLLRVEWRLKQGKGQSINAHYALKYRMDSGKAHVSVSLPAYDNDSLASGTCHKI